MWPFGTKSLKTRLQETKSVKLEGVLFTIKRVDPLSYLDGSTALITIYDKYRKKPDVAASDPNYITNLNKKLRGHHTDVIIAGVVKPVLARKNPTEGEIDVSEVFSIPGLAEKLYEEIMSFTYGKKKVKSHLLVTENS